VREVTDGVRVGEDGGLALGVGEDVALAGVAGEGAGLQSNGAGGVGGDERAVLAADRVSGKGA